MPEAAGNTRTHQHLAMRVLIDIQLLDKANTAIHNPDFGEHGYGLEAFLVGQVRGTLWTPTYVLAGAEYIQSLEPIMCVSDAGCAPRSSAKKYTCLCRQN